MFVSLPSASSSTAISLLGHSEVFGRDSEQHPHKPREESAVTGPWTRGVGNARLVSQLLVATDPALGDGIAPRAVLLVRVSARTFRDDPYRSAILGIRLNVSFGENLVPASSASAVVRKPVSGADEARNKFPRHRNR